MRVARRSRLVVVKQDGGKEKCTSRASPELGALLHKFATDICEISLVCLYKTVSMASSCHGELFKTETEHDGSHVITRRLSCT